MSQRRTWAVLAVLEPLLVALTWFTFSASLRTFARCQLGVADLSALAPAFIAAPALALAIALTFVTASLRNPEMSPAARCAWAVALLFASPVAAPLYWLLFLRRLRDAG